MPTDMMDNMKLLEEVEKNGLQQLNRMEYNDPNRGKVLDEIEKVSKIRNAYDQTELTRLNNNARNDQEEAKIAIDEKKVENERRKTNLDFGKAVLYFVAGFGGGWLSFNMEKTELAFKQMWKNTERWWDNIVRR